ncbi:MAG TPA: methyltransferase domain-containing protein [Pseudolabrys sp.]|nr:methyltransferase domain-containing protein [Pseudolabrys sp.]
MSKTLVQEQFGKTAAGYLTSKPHAKGKSLERLGELVQPGPDWKVLDVATGGGHVAYVFAPHVARVWATDITDEMLTMVRGEAQKRKLDNVRVSYAKAEALPFEDGEFDLVTCRIAPHHFDSIADFLAETHRVLKPGGILALVDNVVPEGSVGDYINAFERFRDPSHLRAWTMDEWRTAFAKAGFAIAHEEQIYKQMEFASWAARHDATMQAFLRAMLKQATPDVSAALVPQNADGDATFRLEEGLFVVRRKGGQ